MARYFDTETCGFSGPVVLLQYSIDDGPIILHHVWKTEIRDTLCLIEEICNDTVIGFNLTYDWFHINRIYNLLLLAYERLGNVYPEDHIHEIKALDSEARDGVCLKPAHALDLLLYSRKGPFQSLMDRKPIRLKRIPKILAHQLVEYLHENIKLDDIYFEKSKSKERWKMQPAKNEDGEDDEDFVNITLSFRASGSLKSFAKHLLGKKLVTGYDVPERYLPEEKLYAPHTCCWEQVIHYHIYHWYNNPYAIDYATKDIEFTRELHWHPLFKNAPVDDIDSILACCIGACRWRGYVVNIDKIHKEKENAIKKIKKVPLAPKQARIYLRQVCSETEQLFIKSSGKKTLDELIQWKNDDGPHPVVARAKDIQGSRRAIKEIELYDKFIESGRFHASFNIIGTLSSRMSGADKLNAQGIKKTTYVRSCFPLANHTVDDKGYAKEELWGGDFDQFEVAILAAVYNDPNLNAALMSGKKIHGLMGVEMYPEYTYEQILESKGTDDDRYTKGKNGVFTLAYFGDENTLEKKYGVAKENAIKAMNNFFFKYPKFKKERERIVKMFCSMTQPGGLGTKIIWAEPAEYIESFLGFRRYFTLENKIVKALFSLASNLPKEWRAINLQVKRREKVQTPGGAVASALYAAAFGIQGQNTRAAGNHIIQSPGAEMTKKVQALIWGFQPVGVNKWQVQPMNIHDEIMCPIINDTWTAAGVLLAINKLIESFKEKVPLVKFEWMKLNTWADKA